MVQLDFAAAGDGSPSRLLVSTLAGAALLTRATETSPVVVARVGTKERDGRYGAAFTLDGRFVYAARPGKRVWKADASGSVKAT